MRSFYLHKGVAIGVLALSLSFGMMSCSKGGGSSSSEALTTNPETVSPSDYLVYGIDNTNTLFEIDGTTLASLGPTTGISGLQAGESVVGMSFDIDSNLIVLGSTSRVYSVDSTGAATEIGTAPFSPALSGNYFGFSINPVTDEFRVTSDTGQNITINPTTGTVDSVDPPLAYVAGDPSAARTPDVVVTATSCNCEAPPTIYGIDLSAGTLVTLGSVTGSPDTAESSTLFTIGTLGFGSGLTGTATLALPDKATFAYATLGSGSTTGLYQIQLSSGAASLVGSVTGVNTVVSLAVLPTE